MKKRLFSLLATLMISVSMLGCGASESESETLSTEEEEEESAFDDAQIEADVEEYLESADVPVACWSLMDHSRSFESGISVSSSDGEVSITIYSAYDYAFPYLADSYVDVARAAIEDSGASLSRFQVYMGSSTDDLVSWSTSDWETGIFVDQTRGYHSGGYTVDLLYDYFSEYESELNDIIVAAGGESILQEDDQEDISTEQVSSESTDTISVEDGSAQDESELLVSGEDTTVLLSDIPEYSGEPYVVINDNEPFFTEDELTTISFESYSDLDSLGRCGTAFASIGIDLMPTEERDSISSVTPTGWHSVTYDIVDGNYLYNRCHLIGYQLSGENANEENLITGTRYLNVEGMLPFENMIADYVEETENHVMYRVTPLFENDNLVADGVLMEAMSVEDDGEGILFCVFCYNVQPGITIDYETGDSELSEEAEDVADSGATVVESESAKEETAENDDQEDTEEGTSGTMVWITSSGTKYHRTSTCSNMKNPKEISKEEAISRGYEACSKCW